MDRVLPIPASVLGRQGFLGSWRRIAPSKASQLEYSSPCPLSAGHVSLLSQCLQGKLACGPSCAQGIRRNPGLTGLQIVCRKHLAPDGI